MSYEEFEMYNLAFRQKVLEIREREGLSMAKVAARFDVGVASVMRWTKMLHPCVTRNKPATKIDMEVLNTDVQTYPDHFLYE